MRVAICSDPFQYLLHLLESFQQAIDFLYRPARPLRDSQAPRSVQDRRLGALRGRHREHDRLDVLQLLVVAWQPAQRLRVHSGQQAQHLLERPHGLHLLERDQEIFQIHPLLGPRLSLEALRRRRVHRARRLLDQPDDVALSQDPARQPYGVHRLERVRPLTHADVLDRDAGHAVDRERRAAARTACRTSSTTPPPLPSSPFPGNTGTPTCSPSCRSCSPAAGRYTSAATRHGAFCSSLSRRASFAAVVVFPEPCKPTSRITVGPTDAKSSPCFVPPSIAAISSCTSFTICWPGLTALI